MTRTHNGGERMECEVLARQVGQALEARGWVLACAESCTGGGVAQALTSVAGSSAWFDRGFVTYSNVSKVEMLGVSPQVLECCGAVSEETVRQMAAGTLSRSGAHISVAISGIAGPGGGSVDKPVGTVWLAWGVSPLLEEVSVTAQRFLFAGDREQVRGLAVEAALAGVLARISDG